MVGRPSRTRGGAERAAGRRGRGARIGSRRFDQDRVRRRGRALGWAPPACQGRLAAPGPRAERGRRRDGLLRPPVPGLEAADLGDQRVADGRAHHADEEREAERGVEDVAGGAPAPALGAARVDLVQQRAEAAQGVARHGHALVDREARDLLAAPAAHDAGLVRMDREALGGHDLAGVAQQGRDLGGALPRGREGHVVGVARVGEAERAGQRGEPRIEPRADEVRQHRARRRPLRQAPWASGGEKALAVEVQLVDIRLRAEQRQHRGDRFRVAETAELALHAPEGEGREEVLEVEVDHDLAADMCPGIGQDRAARHEAVRRLVHRHLAEDRVEHPVLRALEARHRGRDQPLAAGLLRQGEALVVADARERAVVGEEAQFGQRNADRVGQRPGAGEVRQAGLERRRRRVGMQAGRDLRAEEEHLAVAPRVPGERPVVTAPRVTELRLLASGQRLLLAALVHRLERRLGVAPEPLLRVEVGDLALDVAAPLDQCGGKIGLRLVAGPEAEADHFFEDDLVLRRVPDAVVELLLRQAAGPHGHGRASARHRPGSPRDAGRSAFVSSEDWRGPLEGTPAPGADLGSRNPN